MKNTNLYLHTLPSFYERFLATKPFHTLKGNVDRNETPLSLNPPKVRGTKISSIKGFPLHLTLTTFLSYKLVGLATRHDCIEPVDIFKRGFWTWMTYVYVMRILIKWKDTFAFCSLIELKKWLRDHDKTTIDETGFRLRRWTLNKNSTRITLS